MKTKLTILAISGAISAIIYAQNKQKVKLPDSPFVQFMHQELAKDYSIPEVMQRPDENGCYYTSITFGTCQRTADRATRIRKFDLDTLFIPEAWDYICADPEVPPYTSSLKHYCRTFPRPEPIPEEFLNQ